MQGRLTIISLCVVSLFLAGCMEPSEQDWGEVGDYQVTAEWFTVELENKVDYYQDGENVTWTVESSLAGDSIDNFGGNVVGILLEVNYPSEDETANAGLCLGIEDNVADTISATANKGVWGLAQSGTNPGSHVVNLTWHNNSIIENVNISGLSEKEIHDQLAFGDAALGSYNISIQVDAEAFSGPACTHTDDGENVETIVNLLILDFLITSQGDTTQDITALGAGDGEISLLLFIPWFVAIFGLVGYISINRNRFQLSMILEDEESESGDEIVEAIIVDEETTERGNSLVESYKSRVLTLCALYVAQGIPWGFMTVTFVTYLALEGVGAGKLALLLTLGTLPWSIKFLWGPVIDRFQYREMGRRRPWILAAQTGMVIFLSAILFVPDPASNVLLVSIMFCVYNIFTSLQDVATDALAVDILRHNEIEQVNSYMFTSKSIGGIIGGAGLGSVINILGIKGAIALQIPILIVIMLVPIYMTERPGEKRFPWSDSGNIVDYESKEQPSFAIIFANIKTALNIKAAQLGVLLSLTVSLSFFLIPVLPLLFVRELGWTEEQFNQTKGGVILIVTMLGYLVGGVLGKTIGGKATIIYAAVGTAITTTIWGLTEGLWSEGIFMMAIWSLRTFGWAVVMVNIYSLMMKVTWGEVGGTQFTGYMAMMNLSAIIGYQLAEPFASRFDYPTLFIMAAVFETLVVLAVMFIDPDQTRRELGSIS